MTKRENEKEKEEMMVYEKLGLFYLGKVVDTQTQEITENYLLYDSKDLVTHAVCVGMTGSGKTGLCIGLLEEAAIDNIPAIVVDPKGDLTNLKLLFPELKTEDFRPWINEDEAARQGVSPEDYARRQAELWKRGLLEWGQDEGRIRRLLDAADISIYTPGSKAGLPLSVFKSFSPPPPELLEDIDLFRQRISTTVSSLLGLLGLRADPLQSREHILLSNILESAWNAGEALDIAGLIQRVQSPPFRRVGVFELDAFYPAVERYKLAVMLNNLLAAPGFASWMEGEPLDVDSLLYTPGGKARLSIISIAHLTDDERMFFVTLLLNEILGWMRKQPGTSSLRALFYMDEIFGFFPPVSEPPSKRTLLTLLKQARAFGLGLVLTTQNPVDLDYKGLANAGTWFIGRLQTEQDKSRLLEGLAGIAGNIDLRQVSDVISRLKKRVFLMHNVHEDKPVLLQTRWVLSYLRGPLTLQQIKVLTEEKKAELTEVAREAVPPSPPFKISGVHAALSTKPPLPPGIEELFFPPRQQPSSTGHLVYHPTVGAFARAAIFDNRLGIATIENVSHSLEMREEKLALLWDQASRLSIDLKLLSREAEPGASFEEIPSRTLQFLKTAGQDYVDFLTRSFRVSLWKSPTLNVVSDLGESERDFRIRLAQLAREKRDFELNRLRQKYAAKITTLERQLMMAQQRLEREQQQYKEQITHTAISVGATILGSILGRRASQVGRATTSARTASRAYYEKMDIERARQQVEMAKSRLRELELQLEQEATRLSSSFDAMADLLQPIALRPKKKDITLEWSGILWFPFWHLEKGGQEPAFSSF